MKDNISLIGESGFFLILIGFVFGVSETIFFGNNPMPKTIGEAICDAVSLLFVGVGIGMYLSAIYLTIQNHKQKP